VSVIIDKLATIPIIPVTFSACWKPFETTATPWTCFWAGLVLVVPPNSPEPILENSSFNFSNFLVSNPTSKLKSAIFLYLFAFILSVSLFCFSAM
jgi:hypothetical protein